MTIQDSLGRRAEMQFSVKSNRISGLGEHLLNINTRIFTSTHLLEHTQTYVHTNTRFKSRRDRGSATQLEPHLTGFYGNSRLGWGILWCSIPVMQMDEWTVCSVCCLFQNWLSLLDRDWLGCDGITVTHEGFSVVVTLLPISFLVHQEQVLGVLRSGKVVTITPHDSKSKLERCFHLLLSRL